MGQAILKVKASNILDYNIHHKPQSLSSHGMVKTKYGKSLSFLGSATFESI